MRWKLLVPFTVLGLSIIVTAVVACSDSASCKPGTMLLQIALLDTSPLADSIEVMSTNPMIPFDEKFPHTPNASAPGVEHTSVTVTFPNGYPKDTLLNLIVRAYGGVTLLGANTAQIHTGATCTVGDVAVRGGGLPTDMGNTD